MRRLAILILLLLHTAIAGAGTIIRRADDLYRSVFEQFAIGTDFDITVVATTPAGVGQHVRFACEDETGATALTKERAELIPLSVKAGDVIRVTGRVAMNQHTKSAYADCQTIEHVGHSHIRDPVSVPVADLLAGKYDCRPTVVRGMIRDVFRDEIDPEYLYAVLIADNRVLYVPFKAQLVSYDQLDRLVGADVSITGICIPVEFAARRKIGCTFQAADGMRSLHVIHEAFAKPFESSPRLQDIKRMSPQDIALLNRHLATGRVIARWNDNRLLLKDESGNVIGVSLSERSLPPIGETIDVVGFPESDLYRLNLTRAVWRNSSTHLHDDDVPRETTIDDFLSDHLGRRRFAPYAHGQTLRLKGDILSMPGIASADKRLTLRNGDYLVPVDFSSQPAALQRLTQGMTIEVTGTCVMESDCGSGAYAFPRICGVALIIRTAKDVKILSKAPWWTPLRLLGVIASLLAALAAILVWNVALHRIAERRGLQLFRSQIAQTTTALKVEERTRLAVELHDAISQNLSGASMRIDAARKLLEHNRDKAARQLDIASNTLGSCREELRNCIWDLRNEALDERDMNVAIRRTLARHLGETTLSVRFNIPRVKLTDNTANVILSIIRELSVNAIRHGHATEIKVAGSIDRSRLLFSVRDNGSGFDPQNSPGTLEGHFGLQGIRERLKRLSGTLKLESRPGMGTKAVVELDTTPIAERNEHS